MKDQNINLPVFMRMVFGIIALLGLFILAPDPALSVNPDEMLADPQLEMRARNLSGKIRCTQCQNQSIDDSDADFARDIRLLVRERLMAGDSDEAVLDYLYQRYGDFILMKPRFSVRNLALWLAPSVLFLFGLVLAWRSLRRKPLAQKDKAQQASLSAEEEKKLGAILGDKK